jgi:hypothetical protein
MAGGKRTTNEWNDSGADVSGGIGAQLTQAAPEGLHSLLGQTIDLQTFRQQPVQLTLANRRRIVEQALVLIEQNYVHLPHKIAMHAVNPVQRLRLMRARLNRSNAESLPPPAAFHDEMSEIFHTLRDLHTNYLLPEPFRGQLAFLPFLVEEFFEKGQPKAGLRIGTGHRCTHPIPRCNTRGRRRPSGGG